MYIAEKRGTVKMYTVPAAGDGDWVADLTSDDHIVLDLRDRISSFGDHGLNTILVDGQYIDGQYIEYIYATYMKLNPLYGNNCADYGQMDGRPRNTVNGCPVYGRMSRWAISAAGTVAPVGEEDVMLDTETQNEAGAPLACVQFSTHGTPAGMAKNSDDGYIFVSLGDGAGFASVDPGDLGENPCHDADGLSGAFRSQDPARWNGKSLRVNPVTKEITMWSTGHRNPFRMTYYEGALYATETGWYMYEEINRLEQGNNYGWPCFEGPDRAPEYRDFQRPACDAMMATGTHVLPFHTYKHPEVVAVMVSSVSAVAGWTGRIFYGDFAAQYIKSVSVEETDPEAEAVLHMRDVFPVDLKVTPANVLIYVDHTRGFIRPVVYDGPVASPSPHPAPPSATLTAHVQAFMPGIGSLTFTSTDTILGREGAQYVWNVTLLSACEGSEGAQTCLSRPLLEVEKGATYSFPIPALSFPAEVLTAGDATVRVQLAVSSYAGLTARAQQYIRHVDAATTCRCEAGARAPLLLPSPPPVAGSVVDSQMASPPSTSQGGVAAEDASLTYGAMTLQPLVSPWLPGIGNVSVNMLSTMPMTNLVTYTCTLALLQACSADGQTCTSAILQGYEGIISTGRHPVVTFPSPTAAGTLEITCTALTTNVTSQQTATDMPVLLTQSAVLHVPSTGMPTCLCPSSRAAGGTVPVSAVDLATVAGVHEALPIGVALVLPEQPWWILDPSRQPQLTPIRLTCASSLAAQAEEDGGRLNVTWTVTLLRDCSANRTVAAAVPLHTAVLTHGPVWNMPHPLYLGGGTLEVSCRSTLSSVMRVESSVAYLPYRGQPVCLGTAARRSVAASTLSVYTPPATDSNPAPWAISGPTQPSRLSSPNGYWLPAVAGALGDTLSFTVSTPLDGRQGVTYDWMVVLLSSCTPSTCGWSFITSAHENTGRGRVRLTMTAPDVPEGGTLEVTVIARVPGDASAVPAVSVLALPPAGSAAGCACTNARYPIALLPVLGSEGNYSASNANELYRYTGIVALTTPPSPSKPAVDVTSPAFIGGLTAGLLAFVALTLFAGGYAYGRYTDNDARVKGKGKFAGVLHHANPMKGKKTTSSETAAPNTAATVRGATEGPGQARGEATHEASGTGLAHQDSNPVVPRPVVPPARHSAPTAPRGAAATLATVSSPSGPRGRQDNRKAGASMVSPAANKATATFLSGGSADGVIAASGTEGGASGTSAAASALASMGSGEPAGMGAVGSKGGRAGKVHGKKRAKKGTRSIKV